MTRRVLIPAALAVPALLLAPAVAAAAPTGIGARGVDPAGCAVYADYKQDPPARVDAETSDGTVVASSGPIIAEAGDHVVVALPRPYVGEVRAHAYVFDASGRKVSEQWSGYAHVDCAAPTPTPTPPPPPVPHRTCMITLRIVAPRVLPRTGPVILRAEGHGLHGARLTWTHRSAGEHRSRVIGHGRRIVVDTALVATRTASGGRRKGWQTLTVRARAGNGCAATRTVRIYSLDPRT